MIEISLFLSREVGCTVKNLKIPGISLVVGLILVKNLRLGWSEVEEEIGDTKFIIERPIHVVSVVNDQERQIVRITYRCKFVSGKFKLIEEHVSFD